MGTGTGTSTTGAAILPAGSVTTGVPASESMATVANGSIATAQQTLANTGADTGLLPLALVLLAVGALLVIRREKA